jgi:hypothetical protein
MKTLKDLRDFLNSCTEDQLNDQIIIMGNVDEGLDSVTVTSFSELEEDYFVSDEGICPISTYDGDTNEPFEDLEILPKGTVRLYQD